MLTYSLSNLASTLFVTTFVLFFLGTVSADEQADLQISSFEIGTEILAKNYPIELHVWVDQTVIGNLSAENVSVILDIIGPTNSTSKYITITDSNTSSSTYGSPLLKNIGIYYNENGTAIANQTAILFSHVWIPTEAGVYSITAIVNPETNDTYTHVAEWDDNDTSPNENNQFELTPFSVSLPKAEYIIAPTQGLEGITLAYTIHNVVNPDAQMNVTINSTVDTTWNFGDGSGYTSSESSFNTYHTFNNEGIYLVSLTMFDQEGETTYMQWNVTISNRAPIIDSFTIPNQGEVDQILTFSLIVFDSDSISILWDFGEGTIISGGNSQTSFDVNHAFSNVGTYNVTVTATDSNGASTQVIRIIEIIAPPDDRNNLSDYAIISFVVLYSFYSMWRRRRFSNNKD